MCYLHALSFPYVAIFMCCHFHTLLSCHLVVICMFWLMHVLSHALYVIISMCCLVQILRWDPERPRRRPYDQRSPYGQLKFRTRWTFFRVKLVFECEFEISWSLGPSDLGTPEPWNPWTLGLLDLLSSLLQHLLILPLTSSYLLFNLLSSFGMSFDIGEWDLRWTFDLYIDLKKLWGGWVNPGTSSFLLHSLPLTSSNLL